MRHVFAAAACLALLACPTPVDSPDSGTPVEDSGVMDAGHDAGRPERDAGPPDAGWGSVPIADWCRARATAQCWRDIRCGRTVDALLEDCVAQRLRLCDAFAYVRSNAEGRHAYDPTQAGRCLDAHDRGDCEAVPAECATVFTGLTGADAGAYVPEDCDPGAGFYDAYGNVCPHLCVPWAALGERCSSNTGSFAPSCRPTDGCDYTDGGFERFCVPGRLEGESCQSFDGCGNGLICTGGKCVPRVVDAGEACGVMNGYPFCPTDYFCRQPPPDMAGNQPPGTCQRRAGLGGVCAGFGSCLPSLRCSSLIGTGTCTVRLGIGEPCSSNIFTAFDCQDGLYCPNATSRCTPLPGDGGSCADINRCAPDYYCDFLTNYTCKPRLPDGENCNGYDDACLSNECQYGMLPDAGYGYRCVRCAAEADGGR